jgi:hypothetical protein
LPVMDTYRKARESTRAGKHVGRGARQLGPWAVHTCFGVRPAEAGGAWWAGKALSPEAGAEWQRSLDCRLEHLLVAAGLQGG